MTEGSYLKDELGPVLAKGLAAIATARPEDPIEYLALWLLHYLQRKERKAEEIEQSRKLEAEREEWTKGRSAREKFATSVIQREWRAHVDTLRDSERKEAALRQIFGDLDTVIEERVPDEHPTSEGEKSDAERQTEADRLAAATAFARSRVYVAEIDKSYAADLKRVSGANKSAVTVLRACFYLMGMRPRQVDCWEKVRALIKPYPFSQWLSTFQPCGTPLEKKRRIARARRLLTLVTDEAVKKESAVLYAVYQWLNNAVLYREARDENVRVKRAAGKDDEELEEEDDVEDEEKDHDEEGVRQREAEAARLAEAQRQAEAEEAAAELEGGAEA